MESDELKNILIKVNLEKSVGAFKIAELSIRENEFVSAMNRIYYSIFYTVTALAEKHGFKTSKHTAMIEWFNKKFVYQERVFDVELFKVYRKTFKYRQKSDYDTLYIPTFEETTELLAEAKVFIERVKKYINDDNSIL